MVDINVKAGDTVTYGQTQYIVVENRIKKNKKKQKALVAINVLAILLMIGVFLIYFAYINIIGVKEKTSEGNFIDLIIYLALSFIVFFVFIVAHEYVHYLSYRIFGGIAKDKLKFGVVLKMGMAYCISLEPNSVKTSRLSLMMPFYVLVIPVILAAIILQNCYLAFLGAMFVSGSGGDIWYMWTLRKDNSDKYIIEATPGDDGYEIGYLLLDKAE